MILVPSGDWQNIDPMRTQMATFRAVENGYSLVRQARGGLAMAVDYVGRVLATADYFMTDQQVLVAYVPVHGVRTVYSIIGALFTCPAIAGLVIVIGLAMLHRMPAPYEPARGVVEVALQQEQVHHIP